MTLLCTPWSCLCLPPAQPCLLLLARRAKLSILSTVFSLDTRQDWSGCGEADLGDLGDRGDLGDLGDLGVL